MACHANRSKATTISLLRSGTSNRSDIGGVLRTGNIYVLTGAPVQVAVAFATPRASLANAKFILATDGLEAWAENLTSCDIVVCRYPDFLDHFGVFLQLTGISTVRPIPRERRRHQGLPDG
ncbi:MAG: hypothetical protein F4Z55_10505 [Boseongicola sp. SB0667_bin_21]|nr:hypothetical protein [Boseongicola sp. SB0667_bin_21]